MSESTTSSVTLVITFDQFIYLLDRLQDSRAILTILNTLETKMAALDDAVSGISSAVVANEPKLQALADALSAATAANAAKMADLSAQIGTLQATIDANGDVAGAVANLTTLASEVQAEGTKIDDATTALQGAVAPAPAPTPAP